MRTWLERWGRRERDDDGVHCLGHLGFCLLIPCAASSNGLLAGTISRGICVALKAPGAEMDAHDYPQPQEPVFKASGVRYASIAWVELFDVIGVY